MVVVAVVVAVVVTTASGWHAGSVTSSLDTFFGAGTAAAFAGAVDLSPLIPGSQATIKTAPTEAGSVHVETSWSAGKPVGLYRLDYWRDRVHCSLLALNVAYQGIGINQLLMKRLAPWWRSLGLLEHTMDPGEESELALRLCGYRDLPDGNFGALLNGTDPGYEYIAWVSAGESPQQEPIWRRVSVPRGIQHRYLYPNKGGKEGWENVGAPTGWEATRKKGVLLPTIPPMGTYIATPPTILKERLGIENYKLLAGEVVLKATLNAYGVVATGKFNLEIFFGAGKAASVDVTPASAAWHSIAYVAALTQAELENMMAIATLTEGSTGAAIYAWYVDLETEAEEEEAPPPPPPPRPGKTTAGEPGGGGAWASLEDFIAWAQKPKNRRRMQQLGLAAWLARRFIK